jgi:hypothetical protein
MLDLLLKMEPNYQDGLIPFESIGIKVRKAGMDKTDARSSLTYLHDKEFIALFKSKTAPFDIVQVAILEPGRFYREIIRSHRIEKIVAYFAGLFTGIITSIVAAVISVAITANSPELIDALRGVLTRLSAP